MLNSKKQQHATVRKKLVLPDIEPEDLTHSRRLVGRKPVRRGEIKEETVEI